MGLLEQRELTARRRVDELREEADRIHAELDVAEREWNGWVVARSRVGEGLTSDDDAGDRPAPAGQPFRPEPADAAKPKSVIPQRQQGLPDSFLA
ncbi:hypothetical protein [Streptacidiphilus jiangxiensis]|uniref:Uncharacterized protein n=1 Tax=Streptacidiphilus jiangxiensis TaxID=235985 RepID=A0A1H7TPB1_STRJI|nr:hypothetical protein [Streptacidiphilus jiangxiensis]SEL86294.1 hypothetical protein SAMN05414137_114106 [Streptacidiphilus jiangxiensis]